MKKITRTLFFMIALSIVIGVWFSAPISAFAIDSASGEWSYDVEDGFIIITGYSGEDTELTIPSEIDGYKVSGVGAYAFAYCSNLKSLIIPDSVQTLGDNVAYECSSLKSVSIGAGVKKIGEAPFGYSDSLTTITVSSGNECYCAVDNVLFNKAKTEILQYPVASVATTYNIPDTVEIIKKCAFEKSKNLISVNIPSSVKIIERAAFNDSDALTSIIIPDSVESVGWRAFSYCDKLENITMSKGVKEIGARAFDGTSWYNNQLEIADGIIYIGDFAYSNNYNHSEKVNLVIKEGTRGVAEQAFANSVSAVSISLPDTLEYIGERAFLINYLDFEEECAKEVVIPESVKSIGQYGIGYYVSGAGVGGFVGDDLIPDFKITGVAGSVAETYAKANSIDFVAIKQEKPEENPTEHTCSGGEATCTKKAICTECGNPYGELNLNNHKSENGGKEDIHAFCSRCGVTISEKHTFIEKITKEPTVTENGIKTTECSCGYKFTSEIEKLSSGSIIVNSDKNNDCSAKLTDIEDIESITAITDEEQKLMDSGLNLNIVLKLENAETKIDTKEKEAIEKALGENVLGVFLDIKLVKQIGEYEVNVENTVSEVKITLELPESLVNKSDNIKREYKVIRYHEDDAEKISVLDAVYDETTNKLTFATDRFSTYAIVYEDVVVDTEDEDVIDDAVVEGENGKDDVPKAGVLTSTIVWFGGMALSGAGAIAVSKKRKNK